MSVAVLVVAADVVDAAFDTEPSLPSDVVAFASVASSSFAVVASSHDDEVKFDDSFASFVLAWASYYLVAFVAEDVAS